MNMHAKLTEKNIKALEDGRVVDEAMGMCLPGMLGGKSAETVKAEYPSLEPLKELVKTAKTT